MNEPNNEIKLELREPITIKCGVSGAPEKEIADALSDEASKAFKEAISTLKAEPNNLKRNEKFSDILDAFDRCFFGYSTWREHNYIALMGYSDQAISELEDLSLHMSKRGRGGFIMDGRLFGERQHVVTEKKGAIDFLDWVGYLAQDGKIMVESPEQMESFNDYILKME